MTNRDRTLNQSPGGQPIAAPANGQAREATIRRTTSAVGLHSKRGSMEAKYVVQAVSRHKMLVAAIILVTLGAAGVGLWLAPKTYEATATVSVAAAPGSTAPLEDLDALRSSIGRAGQLRRTSLAEVVLAAGRAAQRRRAPRRDHGHVGAGHDPRADRGLRLRPRVAAEIANTVAEVLPLYDVSNGALVFTTSNPARPPTTVLQPQPAARRRGRRRAGADPRRLRGAAPRAPYRRPAATPPRSSTSSAPRCSPSLAPPKDPTTLPALYPGTAAADVFRQLRIGLEAEASADPVSLVVVAGVTDGDVSVWLGANLAVSLANVHRRVLLVDGRVGDQESSPIAAPDTLGLYDVLTGADLGDALSAGPVDNLTVLPAGEWGGESAETLLETRFAAAMIRGDRPLRHRRRPRAVPQRLRGRPHHGGGRLPGPGRPGPGCHPAGAAPPRRPHPGGRRTPARRRP